MANTGFYTLGSRSASFVDNKRNEDGTFEYENASNAIGIERQRALQDLSKNYNKTINNAYASYLAGQQKIANSNMGLGFKEQYMNMQQEATTAQIAEANLSAAKVRQEINESANEAQQQVNITRQQEIANLDRALTMMNDYREYVNSLEDRSGKSMYDDEQLDWDIKYLYNDLFNMDPKDYYEDRKNDIRGKSYAEWLRDNLSDSDNDLNFGNWLYYGGGLQTLGSMIEKSKLETPYETRDKWRTENLVTKEELKEQGLTKAYGIPDILSNEIRSKLDIDYRFNKGDLKAGDVVKYDGYYYEITKTGNIKVLTKPKVYPSRQTKFRGHAY